MVDGNKIRNSGFGESTGPVRGIAFYSGSDKRSPQIQRKQISF
jgi:hypothetical protein